MAHVFIDIHTHRIPSLSPDIRSIWNNILNKNVEISSSTYTTAGLHPWYINEDRPLEGILSLEDVLSKNAIIAIGECGLDKAIAINMTVQQEVFREQIRLAHDYHKALLIHCVRAYEEVLFCIQSEQFIGNVVFHGFNKNKQLATSLIAKGYYLSFGAAILSGKLDDVLTYIPIHRLFLETDDTYVDIRELYHYIANLKKIPLDDLKKNILENYQLVFE
ncbi:TatD family hydrolase [Sphingobacterium sp. SRCM116780]|uniref:TatD family hydrolase n=1 Tax=Sphingobacterium sp. SRCM116780 TaxID=2907623 RepID=UPI001F349F2D|nr:TatD family hydrolase [Sphingobacterium sp. SRCM116780]UIR57555.1 TatD family hydrolase [Sphingobacterium sp. SRCM116780]